MFKDAYLRVLTPETTNGRDPIILPNGKMKYIESHLHVLAKDMMERKNLKRPTHLKHIIDIVEVDVETQPEKKTLTPEEIRAEIKRLEESLPKEQLKPKTEKVA